MATVDPTINDTMTQIQLRQIRQKLDEERLLRSSLADKSPRDMNDNSIKLQQAMLKRQELLDRLRHENTLREDLIRRPASYSARRTKARSPVTSPRRSESQPPPQYPHPHDSVGPRQVIEHQFKPVRLDPLPQPPVPSPVVQSTVPAPYLVNVAGQQQPANTKAEMMEMMMLQNAQMHQMIMNQMMMQAIPKPSPEGSRSNSRVLDLDDVMTRRRPPSVHHHHYDPPSRAQQHPPPQPTYTLPPVVGPQIPYPMYQSPRYYPAELEPLRQPRVKKTPRPKTPVPKKKVYGSLPFPGSWALRKFRRAAYAVFFQKCLEKAIRKKRNRPIATGPTHLGDDFLFGIKLKEVIAAEHAIYLNPSNKIGSLFRQYTSDNARDLVESVNSTKSSDRNNAVEDINFIIENVVYEMTDIMPTTGVLGSHRKAIVVDMCRNGNRYPKGYLWQVEKDFVQFDRTDRTVNVGEFESYMLMLGIYLARGIVTTLLLKPVEYGLLQEQPSPKGQRNLKLMATIFIHLYRRMIVPPGQTPVTMPYEISRFLYSDDEMKTVINNCKDGLNYAEKLIRNWGKEYISRIRKAIAEG